MTVLNLAQFNRDVSAFARNLTVEQLPAFQRKVVLQVLRGVVLKTPVDTGRAHNGWQTTINSFSNDESSTPDPISSGIQATLVFPAFAVVFITNNVPYIIFLEGGSSGQAPNGMVAVTLAEIGSQFT